MLVRQLVGRYAGQTIELPYDRAIAALRAGTATATEDDSSIEAAMRALDVPLIYAPDMLPIMQRAPVQRVVPVAPTPTQSVVATAPVPRRRGRRPKSIT